MNSLMIPPAANWYSSSILACSPDNTLIYGSRNDLVVIKAPEDDTSTADIKLVRNVLNQKVLTVSINKNWGQPDKYCVTATADGYVCLFDITTLKKKAHHNSHAKVNEKLVSACFAGNEKIVSISETGTIVIWHIGSNEETSIKDLFGTKIQVQCLSVCPHASWLTAVGMKNGLLWIVDLRKGGKLLHKLRGHDKQITCLTWCPAPVNVFPQSPHNTVRNKPLVEGEEVTKGGVEPSEAELVALENGSHEMKSEGSVVDETNPSSETARTEVISNEEKNPFSEFVQTSATSSDIKNTSNETAQMSDISTDEKNTSSETACIEITSGNGNDTSTETAQMSDTADEKNTSSETVHADVGGNGTPQTNVAESAENNTSSNTGEGTDGIPAESNESESKAKDEEPTFKRYIVKSQMEKPRKEYLLASLGKDNNIYIWRAGTDGRMQTFLTLSSGPKGGRYNEDRAWITMNWITPNCLLTSSRNGALLKWTIPRPLNSKDAKPVVVHKDHNGNVFSIAAPMKLYTGLTWDNQPDIFAWTAGQDRQLVCCEIGASRKNLASIPTLGGNVLSMAVSNITPSRLGLGLNDGTIKVWEVGQKYTVQIEIASFHQKIQDKVHSLSWHPVKEFVLAFGTSEGRIGVFDTSNHSKPPKLMKAYFKSQIHKLEWGPHAGDTLENAALYALAEGRIMIYSTKTLTSEPIELMLPYRMYAHHFAWKPDYNNLIVSMKGGELVVYSSNLTVVHTLYLRQKGFTNILWHPYTSPENYDSTFWFAATMSGDNNVYLYNLSKLVAEGEDCSGKPEATFSGHDYIVSSLAWDYFHGDRLVTAGEDGIVQVWNTGTGKIISTYVEPGYEAISAVMWSPVDEDHIIIGGKNNSINIYKVSDNPPQNPEEIFEKRKTYVSQFKTTPRSVTPVKSKKDKSKPNLKHGPQSVLGHVTNSHHDTEKHCAELRRLIQYKESTQDAGEEGPKPIEVTHDRDFLQLFGTNEQMRELLTISEETLRERGKQDMATACALWKGDISDSIKKAIEHKAITLRMLALAPMVSTKLWQEACGTYAEQLNEMDDSNPMDVAMYFLACHRLEDAAESLCENHMYKDALALLKCRRPGDDAAIAEVVSKWAKYAFSLGDYETAAECHISTGEYEEAAKILSKRTGSCLEVARELAERCGNKELEKSIKLRLLPSEDKENGVKEPTQTLAELLMSKHTNGNIEHTQNASDLSPEKTDSGISMISETVSTNGKILEASDSFEKIEGEDTDKVAATKMIKEDCSAVKSATDSLCEKIKKVAIEEVSSQS